MIAVRNHLKRVDAAKSTVARACSADREPLNRAGRCCVGLRSTAHNDRLLRGGFTIFELLIVISIVTILAAMLMPALSRARAAAGRIQCASNFRQIGCALTEYQSDYNDKLPPLTVTSNPTTAQWGEAMMITNPAGTRHEGLGLLLPLGYLTDARLLFCPCHRGEHTFDLYALRSDKLDRNASGNGDGAVYSNYHFRSAKDPLSGAAVAGNLSMKVLVVDGMRTKLDFNHIIGTNRLKGDGSVDWRLDAGNAIYRALPTGTQVSFNGNDAMLYNRAWRWIDQAVEQDDS